MVTLESTTRLLAYLVLRAGKHRAGGPAGVTRRRPRTCPDRPKTDKLDAMWLARLTEMGLLRPSFVPPTAIRALRDLHPGPDPDLVQERTRCWQRLEKLLEAALVKLSSVVHKLTTVVGAGHDQGDDRRRARPGGAGRPGPAAG